MQLTMLEFTCLSIDSTLDSSEFRCLQFHCVGTAPVFCTRCSTWLAKGNHIITERRILQSCDQAAPCYVACAALRLGLLLCSGKHTWVGARVGFPKAIQAIRAIRAFRAFREYVRRLSKCCLVDLSGGLKTSGAKPQILFDVLTGTPPKWPGCGFLTCLPTKRGGPLKKGTG